MGNGPSLEEFTDAGAERQGRCTWAVEFALAHLPKTVFQIFDDEFCIFPLSSEIKIGPNLSRAFIQQIFIECVLLSSSGCSLVYSV